MSAKNSNIPRDDKEYRKTRRPIKLVVYMVLSALAVLLIGLVFVWMYDKVPDTHFTHGWNLFFVIVFAILVTCLQLPGYIMDIRKIEMGEPKSPAKEAKPKPYAAVLDHALKENLINEDNKLSVPRTEFVRFLRKEWLFCSSPEGELEDYRRCSQGLANGETYYRKPVSPKFSRPSGSRTVLIIKSIRIYSASILVYSWPR